MEIKAAKGFKDLQIVGQDIMSPEGVEERVLCNMQIIATLTQGGKHRVYVVDKTGARPIGLKDTEKQALQMMGSAMMMEGMMLADPQKGVDVLLRMLDKMGPPK